MNYCDNCDCPACEGARAIEQTRKDLNEIMESWNWNLSATECALEMIRREEYSPEEFYDAMRRFGFDDAAIYDVQQAYETLS